MLASSLLKTMTNYSTILQKFIDFNLDDAKSKIILDTPKEPFSKKNIYIRQIIKNFINENLLHRDLTVRILIWDIFRFFVFIKNLK